MSCRQRGYSLLEVLIAFALLASALGLLLGAMSQASRQVRHGEDMGRARLHAQSLLAGLGIEQALEPGSTQGQWEQGRYRWQLQLQPWQDASTPQQGGSLMHYRLEIHWGDRAGEHLALEGLRLAPSGGVR